MQSWIVPSVAANEREIQLPSVNVIENFFCSSSAVCEFQVILNPGNQMVLEGTFDELVENVWCDQFMNIGSWEVVCERLAYYVSRILMCEAGACVRKDFYSQQYRQPIHIHPTVSLTPTHVLKVRYAHGIGAHPLHQDLWVRLYI